MMEFTLARVAMILCGVVLLAAVVPPVTSAFDSEESAELDEQTELLCNMLDSFYRSEADEMIIPLNSVLPHDTSVSMDHHLVTMINGEQTCIGGTDVILESDMESYSGNDYLRFTKGDNKVMIESLMTD